MFARSVFAFATLVLTIGWLAAASADSKSDAPASGEKLVGDGDWNQWGGSPSRNNTPEGTNIPAEFEPGEFDRQTGEWKRETSKNIKWVNRLGSQSYGNPVVANGHVYVGSNNGAGWIERYPYSVDLGVLLCFDEKDGKFLWQASNEKLAGPGRVQDWPNQGVCSTPLVEGERLWYVTNRAHITCLDTQGFYDDENDGPYTSEPNENKNEADIIWTLDMINDLGVSPHNMANCSITAVGDVLLVCTSNGVDANHENLPSPNAPSFLTVNKNTGEVIWQSRAPGNNILHGQWSSPAYGVLGGVPQVIFGGGDGWLYSFSLEPTANGEPEVLWQFDCNPKESKYSVQSASTRNHIIGTPVIYDGLVYIGVGEDPDHGEGIGHFWCIDPTKRGDVSPQLAVKVSDRSTPIPHRRLQAVIPEEGEVAIDNPNSAMVWHYSAYDLNEDGEEGFEETMHRTLGTAAIKDDILYIADLSGIFHCLDAKTGKPYWTHDLFAATWGSPLVVDGKVYIGDEEGKITVFKHGKELEVLAENHMGNSVLSTPVVANNTLYIANRTHIFAIENIEE